MAPAMMGFRSKDYPEILHQGSTLVPNTTKGYEAVDMVTVTCPSGSLAGDAVYFSGATTVAFADADDPAKYAQAVIHTKLSDTSGIVVMNGNLVTLAGLTAGAKYYLTITATAGNTVSTTESIQLVYIALSTTVAIVFLEEDVSWDTIRFPGLVGALAGVSNPTLSAFPAGEDTKVYHFNKAQSNELFFVGEVPHSYKEGSDLKPHVHWSPIDTDTGLVRWVLDYSIVNAGATFGANTTLTVDDAGDGTANKHQVAALGTISGTGLKITAEIVMRLYRDGPADTYDNDAALLEVAIHFQKDTPGSNQEDIK